MTCPTSVEFFILMDIVVMRESENRKFFVIEQLSKNIDFFTYHSCRYYSLRHNRPCTCILGFYHLRRHLRIQLLVNIQYRHYMEFSKLEQKEELSGIIDSV